ncbi:cell surface glycoprotein 1-like [Anabas testudineus]|uniref:cell surface glycoprotein 1-like n=1 Tax=Anabas testudineus TaxID=64144 RepID=UPI000E459FB7|nr:cell surface glycoprotein 1-like [Anabas testudineus]
MTRTMEDGRESNRLGSLSRITGTVAPGKHPLHSKRPISPAPSDFSMASDRSMDGPPNLSDRVISPLEQKRPVSPAPSDVSMESDRSKDGPPNFNPLEHQRPVSPASSLVSMTSDRSKDGPPNFSDGEPNPLHSKRPISPAPSDVSMASDRSMDGPPNLSDRVISPLEHKRPVSPAPSDVSMTSERSKDGPPNFSKTVPGKRPISPAPSDVSMRSDRSKDGPPNLSDRVPSSQSQKPVSSNTQPKSEEYKNDPPSRHLGTTERDPKRQLKNRILSQYEKKLSRDETHSALYEKNTEDKLKPCSYNDLFNGSRSFLSLFKKKKVRTVLTKGVSAIGKTRHTQKFMVDWAKGKSNTDIDLIVSLSFTELNSRRDKEQSMEEFLNQSFTDFKQPGFCIDEKKQGAD